MTSSPQRTWRALLLLLMTAFVAVPGCQPTADLASQAATEEGTWAYDARKNIWYEASFDAAAGDEVLHQGVLYRVGVDGSLVARGPAYLASLEEASWFYEVAADDEDAPVEDDWVLALGGPDPGHVRLRDLTPGQGFAWHGRVYASRVSGQGELQIRPTGEVLSRVATTFKRHSPQLLEVALALDDGRTTTLSVTDGHPFYLPDEDTYRPVGELAVGTALRTAGGGRAVLVGVERREGNFEVFNFEVEGLHNYYAGDAGVVVHNAKYTPKGVTVYQAFKNGKVVYVGITKNFKKRLATHLRKKGILIQRIPGLSNLTRADARAVEQVLIEFYKLKKHGGQLENLINSIAKTNPKYADALRRGRDLLRAAGYPGF